MKEKVMPRGGKTAEGVEGETEMYTKKPVPNHKKI